MGKIAYLVHESVVKPYSTVMVIARPQVCALRPYRLRIEPLIAPSFMIHDVKIQQRSQFPQCQDLPASTFMQPRGEPFDCDVVPVCHDFTIVVTNGSKQELPFVATWTCLIMPRQHRDEDLTWMEEGAEDLGTRLDRAPELGKCIGPAPSPKIKDHPGFGWDPGY